MSRRQGGRAVLSRDAGRICSTRPPWGWRGVGRPARFLSHLRVGKPRERTAGPVLYDGRELAALVCAPRDGEGTPAAASAEIAMICRSSLLPGPRPAAPSSGPAGVFEADRSPAAAQPRAHQPLGGTFVERAFCAEVRHHGPVRCDGLAQARERDPTFIAALAISARHASPRRYHSANQRPLPAKTTNLGGASGNS